MVSLAQAQNGSADGVPDQGEKRSYGVRHAYSGPDVVRAGCQMRDDGGRKRNHTSGDEPIENGERNQRARRLRDRPKQANNSSEDN